MKRKTTARRSNPRYLIARDGVEVGIYPGFTSVEAVKRAKAQYGRGKYTAEKLSADMYLGRGGEEIAARERLERQRQQRAERLATPSGRKRNGTHIHAEVIDHLDVARVHNPSKYTDLYLDENSRRGKGMGLTPATFLNYTLKGKAKQYSSTYLRALIHDLKTRSDVIADQSHKGGVAYYRIIQNSSRRNPMIDHDEAMTLYHIANLQGHGFAIGEENEDIAHATQAQGWTVLHRYDASLLHAADASGDQFLVGGDGIGKGAWVISLPIVIPEPEEYEYDEEY